MRNSCLYCALVIASCCHQAAASSHRFQFSGRLGEWAMACCDQVHPKPGHSSPFIFQARWPNLNRAKWVQINFQWAKWVHIKFQGRSVRGRKYPLYVSIHIKMFDSLYERMCSVYYRVLSSTESTHSLCQDCSAEQMSQLQVKLYFPLKL